MPRGSERGGERIGVAGGAIVSSETKSVGIPRLRVGAEVRAALGGGRPVVALETSVIGQGLPHPRNLECVDRMAGAIHAAGAVPSWVGVLGGEVVVVVYIAS
jgi:pseudouridine-5'-phosphate glycosidase